MKVVKLDDEENLKPIKYLRKKWVLRGIYVFIVFILISTYAWLNNVFESEYGLFYQIFIPICFFISIGFVVWGFQIYSIVEIFQKMVSIGATDIVIKNQYIVGKKDNLFLYGSRKRAVLITIKFNEYQQTSEKKILMDSFWAKWHFNKTEGVSKFGKRKMFCRIPTSDGIFIEGDAEITAYPLKQIKSTSLVEAIIQSSL